MRGMLPVEHFVQLRYDLDWNPAPSAFEHVFADSMAAARRQDDYDLVDRGLGHKLLDEIERAENLDAAYVDAVLAWVVVEEPDHIV